MTSKRKIVGLAALTAGSLLFMLWLADLLHWGRIAPGTVALKTPPPKGWVLTVQEVEWPREITVMGTVTSQTLTQVAPQVAGRVNRVYVDAGSRVAKGDPLVALAAAEYAARLRQAQAHLGQVQADHERYRRLLKEGAVSPREFEAMEARWRAAQAQVQEAAAFQGYTVLAAPRDGVVAERRAAVGDAALPGQPLVTLYDPGQLQIEGEVNDEYRGQVRLGMPVRLEAPAASWQGEATLAEVFPISQSSSRTFRVRTTILTADNLVPGLFARVHLPLGMARGLLIPQAAVQQVGQLSMVDAVVDGRPTRRQVRLGRQVGDRVEVLAGLQAGEKVLLP